MAAQTRRLTWRGKALIVVLTPLVSFGMLELVLIAVGFRFEPWREHLEGRSYYELRELRIYAPDPDLIWTLRPSTVLDLPEFGFVGMRTNSLGLRGEELPGPKTPGELRVLCLGNSITFGLGLEDGDTWPDRMAESLRASTEMQGRTVRVINAGVPGWSTVQGMRLLDRIGDLDADIVVFWFGLPDAHKMRVLPDSTLSLPVEGIPEVLAVVWKLRVFQLVQRAVVGLRENFVEGTRVSRAEFRGAVERMRDLESSEGPRVIFIREPERMCETIGQLERVVGRARQEGARQVVGAWRLLSASMPTREPDPDLTGVPCTAEDGTQGIYFPSDQPAIIRPIEQVSEDLQLLRNRKAAHAAMMELLPDGNLDRRDLFGNAPPAQVISDNSHLTILGARLAGQAIAREVLRRIGK